MIIYLIKLILILVFNTCVNMYYIHSECKCCCGNSKSGEIGSVSKTKLGTKPPIGTNPSKSIKPSISTKLPFGTNSPKKSIKPSKVKNPEVVNPKSNNDPNQPISTNPSKDTNQQKVKTHKVVKHKPNNDTNQTLGTNTSKAVHWSKEGGIQGDTFEIDLDNDTLKRNVEKLQGFKKIDNPVTNNVKRVINGKFENDQNIYYTINEAIFYSIKKNSNVEIIKKSNSDNYIVFAVKTQVKDFKKEDQKYDYYLVYCDDGNSEGDFGLFRGVEANVEIIILGSGNNLTNADYMFFCCKNLEKIIFTIKGLNTSKVTSMYGMFKDCEKLKELNVSRLNTTNVTNMVDMFNGCESLTSLDVSSFSTQNVTDMEGMFYRCNSLTSLDVSSFNTSNVTNMRYMFYGCSSLTKLDLSNFNTNKVTTMQCMFACCTTLTSLILPNDFLPDNESIVTSKMFDACYSLKVGKVTTKDTRILDMLTTGEYENN